MTTNKAFLLIFFIMILFIFTFCFALYYVIKIKNDNKKFFLSLAENQLPKNETIMYIIETHPFVIFISAVFISGGICFFALAVIFFIIFKENIYGFLALILSLICPLAIFSAKGFSILPVTDNGIYPIKGHNKYGMYSIIEEPIYFNQIKSVVTFHSCGFGSVCIDSYIELKNSKLVNIGPMYYSKKIKNFINNKISR